MSTNVNCFLCEFILLSSGDVTFIVGKSKLKRIGNVILRAFAIFCIVDIVGDLRPLSICPKWAALIPDLKANSS